MDVRKAFGTVVKDRRTHLGWSQEVLAEHAGLHRTYITDIERGTRNVTLENIAKLAGGLGLSIGQLFPNGEAHPENDRVATVAPEKSNPLFEILMVEDNPLDAELAMAAFKQAKITNKMHVVRDGTAALDFLFCRGNYRSRAMEPLPGAILLDINLPKISGFEILRSIKANVLTRDIKVVVLTVSKSDDDAREAARLGAAACISKPVNFHNFSQITAKLGFWWTLLRADKISPPKAAEHPARPLPIPVRPVPARSGPSSLNL